MKNFLSTGLAVVALAIFFTVSGTFYTLEEGQQAVILEFGRTVGEPVTEAGLHVKLPFIQDVQRFEKRLLVWDGDPNQIPTKGREFIWVDTMARWRIADAKKFLESVATETGAQTRLDDIIDSVVRDQVSASELVELVRSASWEVPPGEVLEEYERYIDPKDVHVLAAAAEGGSQFPLSLDRRHVLAVAEVAKEAGLELTILSPAEFIRQYYPQHDEYPRLPAARLE